MAGEFARIGRGAVCTGTVGPFGCIADGSDLVARSREPGRAGPARATRAAETASLRAPRLELCEPPGPRRPAFARRHLEERTRAGAAGDPGRSGPHDRNGNVTGRVRWLFLREGARRPAHSFRPPR